jgi:hypothetical protein
VATHVVPAQPVAVTFAVGQAAQAPPHSAEPLSQVSAHDAPSQVVVPFGEVGQAVHDVPQLATDVSEVQTPEQRWNVGLQTQVRVTRSQLSFVEHWASEVQPGLH